ncbi:mCG1044252, isoform CRA_a [Mus musculus]|nr:mCG1044252, isoform CRA_a [Mus musculus]EDL31826.1 mCG1044252, isoform CRA_a [Mus musculus]
MLWIEASTEMTDPQTQANSADDEPGVSVRAEYGILEQTTPEDSEGHSGRQHVSVQNILEQYSQGHQ